jgi:hypothetical protein
VVIDNLNVVGVTLAPRKADPPALIDPNAVLSHSIPDQLLEAIGWGNLQIIEGMRIVEHAQFP